MRQGDYVQTAIRRIVRDFTILFGDEIKFVDARRRNIPMKDGLYVGTEVPVSELTGKPISYKGLQDLLMALSSKRGIEGDPLETFKLIQADFNPDNGNDLFYDAAIWYIKDGEVKLYAGIEVQGYRHKNMAKFPKTAISDLYKLTQTNAFEVWLPERDSVMTGIVVEEGIYKIFNDTLEALTKTL